MVLHAVKDLRPDPDGVKCRAARPHGPALRPAPRRVRRARRLRRRRPAAGPGGRGARGGRAYVDALRARALGGRVRPDDGRRPGGGRRARRTGCAGALASGGALPRDALGTVARLLPGAPVAVDGRRATVGPVGDLPAPLRLVRRDGRWCSRPERYAGTISPARARS